MSATSTWHPSRADRFAAVPPVQAVPPPAGPRRSFAVRVLTVAAVLAVLASGWWVTNSPLFHLRSLRLEGLRHLSAPQVRSLAGVTPSTNLFWLSPSMIARRVERSPWVSEASVSRVLPSTLVIRVTERRPVAILAGRRLLVAGDGMILGPNPGGLRLPVLQAPRDGVQPGMRLASAFPGLGVARGLAPDLLASVARITADREGEATAVLRDGTTAMFGQPVMVPAKSRALQSVLRWAARSGVRPRYVDVRAPAAPALLPMGVPLPRSQPAPSGGATISPLSP